MQDQVRKMARYQQLRQAGKEVHEHIVKHVTRDDIHAAAQALGVLKRGAVVLDSPEEMTVVIDFCLHNVYRQGHNAVDRLLAEAPYPPGSDHAIFAKALARAWFSCFLLDSLEPGVGVRVHDVGSGESLLIHDINFSQSGEPGLLFASRLIAPEEILMTTGITLPIGVQPKEVGPEDAQGLAMLRSLFVGLKAPEQISQRVAQIMRLSMGLGMMERVSYEDLDEPSRPRARPAFPNPRPGRSFGPPSRVGRNDPCPCGSGRKFKVCCGARR
jgi:hypothetical protein